MSKSRIDILAVGDTASDVFIQLKDYVHVDQPHSDDPRLSLPYGAKIPFEQAIEVVGVGNAANAAVAFARLGLKSALFAHVGDDHHGHEILQWFAKNRVQTEFVHVNAHKKTNYHYLLWYKTDRTQLLNAELYDWQLPSLHGIDQPKWIYLSRLGSNTVPLHHQIARYVRDHPEVKLAFQPDRFQMELGVEKLRGIYEQAEILFCNRQEAAIISGKHTDDIPTLSSAIHHLGPKTVVITDGPDGAYFSDGATIWKMPNYPDPKPPYERTGAGDAYASTVTAVLAMGRDLQAAMLWAPINSMSVVQEVGAQAGLLSDGQLRRWLAKAPANYKPTILHQGDRHV